MALIVLFVGFFSPFRTHAQATYPTPPYSSPTSVSVSTTDPGPSAEEKVECGWLTAPLACVKNIALNTLVYLGYLILTLVSVLLYLAGTILNYVINETILNMAARVSQMGGINIAWKVIRDVMNIAFIFLLVYESIKVIIGVSNTGTVQKFIVNLVLAAVLVNFSLFFTKILIDASNVVTVGFYNSIIGSSNVQVLGGNSISGLSVPFMRSLGVSSFWSLDLITSVTRGGNQGGLLIMAIGGSILFLVVSFVFFAIAIMFIIRYIALILLMMLSPIAYMGIALPAIKPYSKQWWDALQSQLLFAPLYMLMTWVIFTLMNSGFLPNATGLSWSALLTGELGVANGVKASPGTEALLFNFALVIGLAIASLVIAKQTAVKGSSLISAAMGKATAFAGGAVFGGVAAVSRGTVGRAGQAIAGNQWLRERAPDSRIARTLLKTGEKTGSASFDVRAGGIGKTAFAGVDTGKAGGKGGYQVAREEKIKKRMDFAEKNITQVVTGDNIENEMNNRRWTSGDNRAFLTGIGLTPAQIAQINAHGASKNQMEALGINAMQAEHMRRQVHNDMTAATTQENLNRRDRYLHNLSQTHWYTPNLYSGVSEDAEAAERMRSGKKAKKGGKDKILEDLAKVLKEEATEETAETGTPPTTPPAPPPSPPPTP